MTDTFGPAVLRLCALAAQRLGWRPADFWAATPAELATALMPLDAPAPLGRADLDRLMESEDGRSG